MSVEEVEKEKTTENAEEEITKEEEIEELKKEIEEKDKEIEKMENIAKKAKADLENYKKRMNKKIIRREEKAKKEIAKDLLDVIDSFEKALESVNETENELIQGIKNTNKLLKQRLKEHGLKAIETQDKKFDPEIHKAIATIETEDHEENQIIEVIQNGYKFKENVIRPALVKLAKNNDKSNNNSSK